MADSIRIRESRKLYVVDAPAEFTTFDPNRVYNTFHIPQALRQKAYEINLELAKAQATSVKPSHKRAIAAVQRALRTGDLVRPGACENCGKRCKVQGHHVDYEQPLMVAWLCKKCHIRADQVRRMGEGWAVSPSIKADQYK